MRVFEMSLMIISFRWYVNLCCCLRIDKINELAKNCIIYWDFAENDKNSQDHRKIILFIGLFLRTVVGGHSKITGNLNRKESWNEKRLRSKNATNSVTNALVQASFPLKNQNFRFE